MKVFRVNGQFRMGRSLSKFSIEAIGAEKDAAISRVLSTIGSRHGIDRHNIFIKEVTEISADKIEDPVVRKQLSLVK